MATFSPVPVGTEFRVNATTAGDQDRPTAIGLSDGGFMATWHVASAPRDLYAQRFDASGNAVGAEIHVAASQATSQIVATADGGFVEIWSETSSASDIYAQLYAAGGTVDGSPFLVGHGKLADEPGSQGPSSVAGLADGGFVVTWIEDGVPQAALVAQGSTSPQAVTVDGDDSPFGFGDSYVQTLTDGGFVISYHNVDDDYGGNQRFDGSGQAVTAGLDLPTFYADSPVAEMENGGFVMVYRNSSGVRGYIQGAPEGNGGFQIATGTTSMPTISALPDGGFLVTWTRSGSGSDGDGTGVFGQRFDADFHPLGAEIQLNTFTPDNQSGSAIAVLDDGTIVTLWVSAGQDGDDGGIYAQRFEAADPRESARLYTDGDDVITFPDGTDVEGVDGAGGRDTLVVTATQVDLSTADGGAALYVEAYGPTGAPVSGSANGTLRAWDVEVVEIHARQATIAGDYAAVAASPVEVNYFGDDTKNVMNAAGLTGSAQLTAFGNGGDDTLIAGTGGSTLDGGADNDRLVAGAGADTMIGGAGIDTAAYTSATTGVTISLLSGNTVGGYAQGDTFSGIENLTGSDHADFLKGDAGANRLEGGQGDDRLDGYTGDDVLVGGLGADILNGDGGSDTADYVASTAGVTIDLGTGQAAGGHAQGDTLSSIENLIGSDYADMLTGDAGANHLQGGSGNDTLNGGAGDDILEGSFGHDMLAGGSGDDTLLGGGGDDVLLGGAGADILNNGTASYAGSAAVAVNLATGQAFGGDATGDVFVDVDSVIGSAYADILSGDSGSNRLDGDAGDDLLAGGEGSDTLIGGAGNDTASYAYSGAGVAANLITGVALGGFGDRDSLSGIENLIGSDYADYMRGDNGANRIEGGGGADRLQGEAGSDVLIGGSGDDILRGGASGDVLNGGAGTDTASYDDASAVTISLASGNVAGAFAVGDTFVSIENLTGSDYADFLKGDSGGNQLDGGAGDDLLEGGAGADVLIGGVGTDTARYAASAAGVTVSLLTGNAAGGEATGDTLSGIENLIGSNYADFLKGDDSANRLDGGAGADLLEGGAGADALIGGAGTDTAGYSGSAAAVTISLLTGNTAGGDAAGDTFSGIENLIGSDHHDFLKGDAGANRLEGGSGHDKLEGYAGNDVLVGGAGNDRFIFKDGFGNDTITDFLAGAGTDDRLDFRDNASLNSYADAMAAATQDGADTLIDIGGGDSLRLIGVTVSTLHQDDFLF